MILVIDEHNDISPKIMNVELQLITRMIWDIEKHLVAEFPKSKTRSLNMHYFNNIIQSTSNAKRLSIQTISHHLPTTPFFHSHPLYPRLGAPKEYLDQTRGPVNFHHYRGLHSLQEPA
jgi:hypothetical protein